MSKLSIIAVLLLLTTLSTLYYSESFEPASNVQKGDGGFLDKEPAENKNEIEILEEEANLKYTWEDSCRMGEGFRASKGCTSSPFSISENEFETHNTSIYDYNNEYDIFTSSSTVEKFISHQASLKGSGWGLKASVGLNFVSENAKTLNSITYMSSVFYIGKNVELDASSLKLSPGAKAILLQNPQEFFRTYGDYVVIGYTEGAEHISCYTFSSSKESELKEIEGSIGAGFGTHGFSIEAEYKYKNKVNEFGSDVKESYKMYSKGSAKTEMSFTDPKAELEHFFDNLKPYRVSLYAAEWQSIPDVINTVNEIADQSIRDSFLEKTISPEVLERVTVDYEEIKTLENEILDFQEFYNKHLSLDFEDQIEDFLVVDVHNAIENIEEIDDYDLRSFSADFNKNSENKFDAVKLKRNWRTLKTNATQSLAQSQNETSEAEENQTEKIFNIFEEEVQVLNSKIIQQKNEVDNTIEKMKSELNDNLIERYNEEESSSGDSVSVECQYDEILISGGCFTATASERMLLDSYRSGNGWECYYGNNKGSSPISIRAYSYCRKSL